MLQSALVGGLIGAGVVAVMAVLVWLINRGKTGAEYLQAMPSRKLRFTTETPPDKIMAALASGVPEAKATLMQTDEKTARLVLASPMSLATWGFWYPIHITPAPGGGSQVDVGITSRGFQWGPLVTKAHKNFIAMVQARVGGTPPAKP